MRTKHVLMAMALPALFAACTSDEFVEQPAQGNLDGRAVLGNLQVNVAEDAATRFAWDVAGWTFQDGDQFGAAVTDPTKLGTVENDQMLGNYIFSKNGNGYTTTSQMVEGTYLFYSYNQPESFVNKNTRDLIAFDLTTQTADLNDPKKAVSDNQLFISPLYFIEAENTTAENTIDLPLRFIPYYSTAAFRIKNSTGADFSISQIVLNGKFEAKGYIDPTAIWNETNAGKGLYYSVPEGGDAYELTALKKEGMTDAQVEDAYEKAYSEADLTTGATGDYPTIEVNSLVLNCNDFVLANGKEVTAYMQVPVGQQDNMTATIIVRVNGVSREINVTETAVAGTGEDLGTSTIASTGIKNSKFTRTATKAVFGLESNNTLKVLDVKANNLQSAGGFYVDSNEELLEVLDRERGDINFYNTGDVEINDAVINVLNTYTAGAVTFSNPIKINVESAETLTLSSTVGAGITFAGDVTVNGNVGLGANVELENNLTVESGKVVLSGADVSASNVTVEGGELELAAAGMEVGTIRVTNGTVNVTANQTIGANGIAALNMSAGSDKEKTILNINGTAQKAVELEINGSDNLMDLIASEININEYATLGTTKAVGLWGKVVNHGTLGDGWQVVVNENAVVENYGAMVNVTNYGLIKMMDVWESELGMNSTAGTGLIDNTVGKDLKSTTGNTVYSYSTGSISSIPSANVDVVVLNGTTVADGTTMTPENNQTILLLGSNTFGTIGGEGVVINDGGTATGTTLQIGLAATDQYQTLAQKAAGITFTAQYTPAIYSANMTTTVNAGTITVNTLNCYGGTNRCAGTITYTTGTAGDWTLNGNGSVTK